MANRLQMVFLVVAVGLLLTIIGMGTDSKWVILIGELIMPIALLWGGLFLQGESLAMRVAMLAIGGFVIGAIISSGGVLSYLL